ncbi:MAG TPA: four-carbon acid sugar kinase family protein [Ktedonobacteraceae bacterium]|jgi:uncharacterized protein YgbK (DUF1537 family)
MTARRVGVVADDLTGAADTTLAFWQHGFATFILLDETDGAFLDGDAVITIDTDSRHTSPHESGARVTDAVRRLQAMGVDCFYKKIDSTMRGNPGAEIEAMMHAANTTHAVICPAFPQMGRTVIEGRVMVRGQDLMLTSAASDPRSPVTTSRIAEILARQTTLPIEELAVADLARIDEKRHDRRITVIDAQTDEDLLAWVQHFGTGPDVLWVGSAGLAETIASEAGMPRRRDENQLLAEQQREKAVLVVVGSMHTASREQVALLCASPHVTTYPVEPAALIAGTLDVETLAFGIGQALERGENCVLYTQDTPESAERLRIILDTLQRDFEWGGGKIAKRLSEIVHTILASVTRPVDLVLTGGDTAKPTLASLGIDVLRVVQMVAPGTPISETLDEKRRVVTKAGGFGNPDILIQSIKALIS